MDGVGVLSLKDGQEKAIGCTIRDKMMDSCVFGRQPKFASASPHKITKWEIFTA